MAKPADLIVANQGAASARTDINNINVSIASNFSQSWNGTSVDDETGAPTTIYKNQWWYDSSSNILYIRNEANDAWIKVGELNQTSDTFSAQLPAGMIQAFAGSSAPTGWLKCNGTAVSRTTYSALFAQISTTYGAGNGSTTFNVPDLRGEFIRGWDDGRGVDSGRSLGSYQADELKSHTHNYTSSGPSGGGGYSSRYGVPTTRTTAATGGNETRPRNLAFLYCIKY